MYNMQANIDIHSCFLLLDIVIRITHIITRLVQIIYVIHIMLYMSYIAYNVYHTHHTYHKTYFIIKNTHKAHIKTNVHLIYTYIIVLYSILSLYAVIICIYYMSIRITCFKRPFAFQFAAWHQDESRLDSAFWLSLGGCDGQLHTIAP